jgi:hypothetical protein
MLWRRDERNLQLLRAKRDELNILNVIAIVVTTRDNLILGDLA